MRQEPLRVERRADADERLRRLGEIEAIAEIVGAAVAVVEARYAEILFGEMENAAELMLDVRDVTVPCVRRDDEQRHSEAQPHLIELLRRNVIVPAAPVVPGDEYRRAVPEWTRADRVDNRGHP